MIHETLKTVKRRFSVNNLNVNQNVFATILPECFSCHQGESEESTNTVYI